MSRGVNGVWAGERNRKLGVYRPCPCRTCTEDPHGVGYLSSSDAKGHGFTVWIDSETVFRRLKIVLRCCSVPAVSAQTDRGLQNSSPPKPDRIELLKQVRRATVDDQLYLLRWLEGKYSKIRPKTT
jgi:hypothetical protein